MPIYDRALRSTLTLCCALVFSAACGDGGPNENTGDGGSDAGVKPDSGPAGLPVLGSGQHTMQAVKQEQLASKADGLNGASDVAVHPIRKDELWITSQNDDAMVMVFNAGLANRQASKARVQSGVHFLANPSGIAFNTQNGFFATSHEEDQATQTTTPADFMGPTLWTSDLKIFDGGHGGHMDMLHNTPNGMGVAWEKDNVYWLFDGYHSSLTRYDFKSDHGPAGSDHRDGIVHRYAEGQVKRVANVPSHMELDHASSLLYVADTGNGRVAALDIRSGTQGSRISPNYDGSTQMMMDNAKLTTFIDGRATGLKKPSGLALAGGVLYVSDNETGKIHGFDIKDGKELDWLDTGLGAGALRGIDFDASGRLYVVDGKTDQVLRISAKK